MFVNSRSIDKQWEHSEVSDLPLMDGEIIDISATALHNAAYTKTELAQKRRLEIMVPLVLFNHSLLQMGKGQHRLSNRKGQLSVLIMEAESTRLLEEERRQSQKQMKKETKKKYGW